MLANHRLLSLVFPLMVVAFVTCVGLSTGAGIERAAKAADPKLADGLTAWEQVYSVLTSPRCINCHTATNYPQQGDDRHRHFANVIRGPEGKGVPGLNCVSCHQSANADSTGVPGGHNWHLAPLSMRWQDENDQPLSSALDTGGAAVRSGRCGLLSGYVYRVGVGRGTSPDNRRLYFAR